MISNADRRALIPAEIDKANASPLERQDNLGKYALLGLAAVGAYGLSTLIRKQGPARLSLTGKTVLITGGSRGLGLALAREFGEQGCRVALCARDQEELDAARNDLTNRGISCETFAVDITDASSAKTLLDGVNTRLGSPDILINNAGLIKVGALESLTAQDFEEAMNLMFWAPFHLSFAMLPHMRSRKSGVIVNISSVGGRVSIPHLLPYACAKFALTGFSDGLIAELHEDGIDVLTVSPGLMRTGSQVNAVFKGKARSEFAWFSLLGNLPGLSVAAEHAAEAIRRAVETRQHSCVISFPAKMLIVLDALIPEAMKTIFASVNRLALPDSGQNTGETKGRNVNSTFGNLFHLITALGQRASQRFNEN